MKFSFGEVKVLRVCTVKSSLHTHTYPPTDVAAGKCWAKAWAPLEDLDEATSGQDSAQGWRRWLSTRRPFVCPIFIEHKLCARRQAFQGAGEAPP